MKSTIYISKHQWKWFITSLLVACGVLYIASCIQEENEKPSTEVQVALEWNQSLLNAEVWTEGYRGPVAARTYGYVGLAAYQAGLPGFDAGYSSLEKFFPEIEMPAAPSIDSFHLPAALNAAYYTILHHFFMSSPQNIRAKHEDLRIKWEKQLSEEVSDAITAASVNYGKRVADAIYKWSRTDTIGTDGNLHNYDRNYKPPQGDGLWVTSVHFPMPALLPSWGGARPFVIKTEDYIAKPLPPYTPQVNQFYHVQAVEVMTLSSSLSSENKWIADFWNDDRPGVTFSPAGHWLAITNQVIEMERPTIEKTLETYARIGFALSDAMIACWKAKYIYNVERPETFIQKHLDENWRPYSPTPPFPSYPSGHSMMGAAAAEVLTSMYGENYKMMDVSHKGLTAFTTKPREFTSFKEMSKENALSRILMGVHYRFDCEEGLRLGELIGQQVVALKLEEKLSK